MRRNLAVIVIAPGPAQRWRFPVRGVLGIGLGFVFGGQFKKTFLGHSVVGATAQASASVGLLSKIKGLRHRTLTQQGGSPVRALSCRRLRFVADNDRILGVLCPVGDSILSRNVGSIHETSF
jgi:hypothetical protein